MLPTIWLTVAVVASVGTALPRNVLLIISDDLRFLDHDAVTPNIEKFSNISLKFNHAYAQVNLIFFFKFYNCNILKCAKAHLSNVRLVSLTLFRLLRLIYIELLESQQSDFIYSI